MDITRMAEEEAKEKKSKDLTLKPSIPSSNESDEENAKGSESENLTLLVRKFKKFLKKNNSKGRFFQQMNNFKKNDSTSPNFTYFECGKLNCIKYECSIHLKKQQEGEKKGRSYNKKKTWEKNDTSSHSNNEEEENLCLMANGEVESVVSFSKFEYELDENYDQFLNAFNEMHEEAQKLSLANNFLKPHEG